MSSSRVSPLECPKCRKAYKMSNRMLTLSCGHSQCASCTKNMICCTCMGKKRLVSAVDVSTFVCAGCNRHYINHYDTVINQVRILKCGHRRMCNHNSNKCAICSANAREISIDVSMTALVCRVCITDPSIPRQHVKPNKCCFPCCRRKKTKYENI